MSGSGSPTRRDMLIQDFSLRIRRGDRIGLVGNNGVGKSTLLRLLLGEIDPDAGSIKWGVNIQLGYFDQHLSSFPVWTHCWALR